MFVSAVDMTIINIALPDISADLGAGISELQWIVDSFLVVLAALLLVGSGLGDRFGRRLVFQAGFALFALASVLAALAGTPEELVAARALMGAGMAGVLPTSLALLTVIFEPEERPRALAIWAVVASIALALGPALGGVLVDLFGWQAVFLVNVPVAVALVPAAQVLLPESRRPGVPPLDLIGAALSAVALAAVVFALIEAPISGWTDPVVLAALVGGGLALVAFIAFERRNPTPLFDVRVLLRPRVASGATAILASYIAFLGVLFILPQYVQYVHDRSATVTGLAMLPLGIGGGLFAPLSRSMLQRWGGRATLSVGLLGGVAACLMMAVIDRSDPLVLLFLALGLFGAGIVTAVAPATSVILNDLGTEKAGDGGAVNQLARQGGGALGVAIIGSVFAFLYRDRIDADLDSFGSGVVDRASESIEGATDAAAGLAAGKQQTVLDSAVSAFDAAGSLALATCAGILLAAALVALIGLRPRQPGNDG